ncbi:MAG TPA: hypothetical protein H9983_07785 [Candidatus Kurthia intestinigallinarum]|nr:hypothetical protein [Candidatus Kurthia intestinigallinarum]
MAKVKKREPYVVGQRVWLEELSWYGSRDEKRSVREFEIVKANNTSAYATWIEQLEAHKRGERVSMVRIDIRKGGAKNSVSHFNVWQTKEAFERNVQYNKELKELRAKAIHLVSQMNVNELRKVLEI